MSRRLTLAAWATAILCCACIADDGLVATGSITRNVESSPLRVEFEVLSTSGTSFDARVRISNDSASPIDNWELFAKLPAHAVITAAHGAITEPYGTRDYLNIYRWRGGRLEAGASLSAGFSGRLGPCEDASVWDGTAGDPAACPGWRGQSELTGVAGCRAATWSGGVSTWAELACDGSDDLTAPAPIETVELATLSDSAVRVSWPPAADPGGIQGYRIYQTWPYSNSTTNAFTSVLHHEYTFHDLVPGQTRYFTVTAVDRAGNESQAVAGSRFTVTGPARAPSFAFRRYEEWPGGYNGEIEVANTTDEPIVDWSFSFLLPGVTWLWYADWDQVGDRHYAGAPTWNSFELPPGQRVVVRFTVRGEGALANPTECEFRGDPCAWLPAD